MTETDVLSIFAEKLAEAGLLEERIEADGALHRCGTSDKPASKNGAYRVHLDAPASVWWQSWQTGESGVHCVKSEKQCSPAERETFRRRVAEARTAAELERAERRAEAAKRAQTIWNRAVPATGAHPYL